jgi:hypothetical protein
MVSPQGYPTILKANEMKLPMPGHQGVDELDLEHPLPQHLASQLNHTPSDAGSLWTTNQFILSLLSVTCWALMAALSQQTDLDVYAASLETCKHLRLKLTQSLAMTSEFQGWL